MASVEPAARSDVASASVNRDSDGEVLGAPLFLGAGDLKDLLGDSQDVSEIRYWVEDGAVHVAPSRQ